MREEIKEEIEMWKERTGATLPEILFGAFGLGAMLLIMYFAVIFIVFWICG